MQTYKYFRFIEKDSFPIAVRFMPKQISAEDDFHSHEFSEIVLITEGSTTHKVDGESVPVQAGDVLIIHPGTPHAYGNTEGMELLNIIYDAKMPLPLLESCGLPFVSKLFPIKYPSSSDALKPILRISDSDIAPVVELTRRLDYEANHLRPGRQVLILSIFMEIIIWFARCDIKENPVRKPHFAIAAAINFINEHFSEKISIADIKKKANMSERNLFRHFRNTFGVSPNEYLLHIRIQRATELLLNTNKQVSKIALECGFCDSNHLTKVFKKIVGSTPRNFRLQNQK